MGFTSRDRTPGREIQDPDDVAYVIPEVPEDYKGYPWQGMRNVRFQLRGAGPSDNPVLGGPIIAEHEYHSNNTCTGNKFTITYYGMNRTPDQAGKKYEVYIQQYWYEQLKCCFVMSVKGRWPLDRWGRIKNLFRSAQEEKDEGRWSESTWIKMKFECRERNKEFSLECSEVGRTASITVPRFKSQGDIAEDTWKDVFNIGRTMGLEISHVAYLAWIATMWTSSLGWVEHANDAEYHKVPMWRF
ncbi:hypothetical protein VFPPC_13294 [Pochonia chlamydosporia 170]|uniref:Uncharacterized protein n=1 Tax=Pochonia chlamydosporia 170 TaxID=1380566 RepID=A0A179FWJ3_METCM|nr:hypothetical protein VFPPC_13294 [Pochonia chlamydosporia 170]OAQ70036.1 hypothetical protein VFPPC_13294 [Pochonia chlamydosporia 170]